MLLCGLAFDCKRHIRMLHAFVAIPRLCSEERVGRAVTCSSLEREICGSNLGPVKLDTVLPTARHRRDVSLKGVVLPGRNDAKIGPDNP